MGQQKRRQPSTKSPVSLDCRFPRAQSSRPSKRPTRMAVVSSTRKNSFKLRRRLWTVFAEPMVVKNRKSLLCSDSEKCATPKLRRRAVDTASTDGRLSKAEFVECNCFSDACLLYAGRERLEHRPAAAW